MGSIFLIFWSGETMRLRLSLCARRFLGAPASPPAPFQHKGWYSRNYLPHLDQSNLIQAITFRLHDALPQQTLIKIQDELKSLETSTQ